MQSPAPGPEVRCQVNVLSVQAARTLPGKIGKTGMFGGYTYDPEHIHAVAATAGGDRFSYDENGNMIERIEDGQTYTQVFDAENRLIEVTVDGQTTQFVYDGQGNLVKRVDPDGSYTLYFFGIYEIHVSGSTETDTIYYPVGGAMRVDGELYFILTDHLGSARVVVDEDRNEVGRMSYDAFGEMRFTSGEMNTDRLYTGQQDVAGIGLYFFQARFYNPAIGRFISADTITPGGPQGLNRYAYVNNSPINYNDPSGHLCIKSTGVPCIKDDDYEKPAKKVEDTQLHRILIGYFDSFIPYYLDDSESTCAGCDWEPEVADPFTAANVIASAPGNITTAFDNPNTADIAVFLDYEREEEGNVTIPTLTINNRSGTELSVMNIFIASEYSHSSYVFEVDKQNMISPKGHLSGIRTGGNRLEVTTVDLAPHGNQNYPLSYPPDSLFEIYIALANSWTHQYYPAIHYSSYVNDIGH